MWRKSSDISKVISADTFERPIYAGNAIATVQSLDAIKVITVRGTGFDAAAQSAQAQAAIETVAAVAVPGSTTYLGSEIAKNDRPETDRSQNHRPAVAGPWAHKRSLPKC